MTERKPREISFTSWIDRQISEAQDRGAFDNLPGAGKPLPRRATDTDAWLRDYLDREGVPAEDMLPVPLRLRKEAERVSGTLAEYRSEHEVREVVRDLNRRILEWRRIPVGPPVVLRLVDEEATVTRWRELQPRPAAPSPPAPHPEKPARSRWWRRRRETRNVPNTPRLPCRRARRLRWADGYVTSSRAGLPRTGRVLRA